MDTPSIIASTSAIVYAVGLGAGALLMYCRSHVERMHRLQLIAAMRLDLALARRGL